MRRIGRPRHRRSVVRCDGQAVHLERSLCKQIRRKNAKYQKHISGKSEAFPETSRSRWGRHAPRRDVDCRLFEKTCCGFFEVVALRCSTTKHGRDRPPATTPTEQPPRKLSGKRTVQREHLER